MLNINPIGNGAIHVTTVGGKQTLLTRYGFLQDKLSRNYADCQAQLTDNGVRSVCGGVQVDVCVTNYEQGFKLEVPLQSDERFFGLGDANRDSVMIRGKVLDLCTANVTCYGPMPVIISSNNWAIIVNSTYCQKFDVGATDKNLLKINVKGGSADFYLLHASSIVDLVSEITDITGKPAFLPAFGYGMTFVENEQATNAKSLLTDIRTMRDRGIACDVFGLEPSWMSKYYDTSTEKTWNDERFYIPNWLPQGASTSQTFFSQMKYMGMQLSLWLCNDYDLLYEEERQVGNSQQAVEQNDFSKSQDCDFVDSHLVSGIRWSDTVTKIDEPWFEHLKKFVDNGAGCFKLDAAFQVNTHPQRLWAQKYLDDEVHNVYSLIYSKQMQQGFAEHTGRRAMIYTSCGYLGSQRYAATWTGDTGGGPRTLTACLNYAMCGHTNTTCDMNVLDTKAIHYAFLSTWTQICSWGYYLYPWFLPTENEQVIRNYATLRSTLFPYLYATAHNATVTGVPVMRPLPMMYQQDVRFDNVTNAYMLGDNLFVGAFDMHLMLPQGEWVDYFTGKRYAGDIDYQVPQGYAGALFAKVGAIVPTMRPQQYVLEKQHDYVIKVFLGGDGNFDLYEDDQFTYDYQQGKYATTHFEQKCNGKSTTLTVGKRQGDFDGRPNNGHDIMKNTSIPVIDGIQPVADITVQLVGDVTEVKLNGKSVPFTTTNGVTEFVIPATLHEKDNLQYEITTL